MLLFLLVLLYVFLEVDVHLIFGVLPRLGELSEESMRIGPLGVGSPVVLVPARLLPVLPASLGLLRAGLVVSLLDVFCGVGGGLCRLLLEVPVFGLLDGSCCVVAGEELRVLHGMPFRNRLPTSTPLVVSRHRQPILLLGSLLASSAARHDERLVLAHLRRRRPRLVGHDGICWGPSLQFHTLHLQANRITDFSPFVSQRAFLARNGRLRERLLRLGVYHSCIPGYNLLCLSSWGQGPLIIKSRCLF